MQKIIILAALAAALAGCSGSVPAQKDRVGNDRPQPRAVEAPMPTPDGSHCFGCPPGPPDPPRVPRTR